MFRYTYHTYLSFIPFTPCVSTKVTCDEGSFPPLTDFTRSVKNHTKLNMTITFTIPQRVV